MIPVTAPRQASVAMTRANLSNQPYSEVIRTGLKDDGPESSCQSITMPSYTSQVAK